MMKKLFILIAAGAVMLLSCSKNDTDDESMVDLGLSVKWRAWNLGATCPDEYGDYYAWGVDTTESYYDWLHYKWMDKNTGMLKKYNTLAVYGDIDWKVFIEPEDDIAHIKLGGKWRIPTEAEWDELEMECVWKWVDKYGIYGYEVISKKNGKSIFFPFAGACHNNKELRPIGSYGFYWTSTLNIDSPLNAVCKYMMSGQITSLNDARCYGLSIRPVSD